MGGAVREDEVLWRRRFLAPQIHWTQIAREAPNCGLVGSDQSGVSQLYAWETPTDNLRQLTDRTEGVPYGVLSPDARYAYYFQDERGNEVGHYVRVPFAGGPAEDITPDLPPYASWQLAISGAGNVLAFILADAEGFHLYCIDITPTDGFGRTRLLYETKRLAEGPLLSHDGDIVIIAIAEHSDSAQFSLVALSTSSGEVIGKLWDGPESNINPRLCSPVAGDARLLATTNRTGFRRPLLWNPSTGERIDFELGDMKGAVIPWDWTPDGTQVLLCTAAQAVQQLYLYDLASGTVRSLQHPGGTYWYAYFGPEGDVYAEWEDATHPRQLITLDADTGNHRTILSAGVELSGHGWRSVTFASFDGQQIQGWLGVPDGAGPFPTILEAHGGPASWVSEQFSPESQAWLDHGYAYLTVNYRGSSSFGRAFEEQVYGNPGYWEVEDMVAARRWLIETGIARPEQILLRGCSYGGYLTLQALGTRPDLWAGGIAEAAIADWRLSYEDAADNNRQWQVALFGGTPAHRPEQYARSSPITYAEDVSAPILVIQGRHDARCPARQMQVYEAKLRALGKSIEVHWFDAGHASLVAEERLRRQELMLRFAERVLASG